MTFLLNLSFSLLLLATIPLEKKLVGSTKAEIKIDSTIFITEWENSPSWNETIVASNKQYILKRQMVQLTRNVLEKGVVLVFSKGYNFTESTFSEKPLPIPFYFFSSDESAKDACEWFLSKVPGEIELGLTIPNSLNPAFQQKKTNIQLRYILLEENFLKKQKLSKTALMNMSYLQIINLINATP